MRKSEGTLPCVAALLVFVTAACSGSVRTTDANGEGDGDRNEPGADVPVPDDIDQDEPGMVTQPGRPGSGIGGSSGSVLNAEVSHGCYSESAFAKVVDLADDAPNGWTSLVPVDGPYIRAHYFVEPSGIYVAMREPFRLIRFPETGGTYETVFTHEYPVAHPLVLDDGVLFFSHALEQEAGADGFGGPSRFVDATSGSMTTRHATSRVDVPYATDGEAIYAWSEDLSAIEYAPIGGGDFSTFPVPAPTMGGARQVGDKVLVDDEAVYVAQSLGAFAQIVRIDKSTGETQVLVDRDDTWETPAVLTITDQELIYYYSSFDGFTSIESVPLQGGPRHTIASFPDEQWQGVKNALVVGDDVLAVVYVDGISGPTAVWIEQYQLEERIVGEPLFDHVNDVYRTNDALVLFRGGVEFQRCAFSE